MITIIIIMIVTIISVIKMLFTTPHAVNFSTAVDAIVDNLFWFCCNKYFSASRTITAAVWHRVQYFARDEIMKWVTKFLLKNFLFSFEAKQKKGIKLNRAFLLRGWVTWLHQDQLCCRASWTPGECAAGPSPIAIFTTVIWIQRLCGGKMARSNLKIVGNIPW